MSRIKNLFNNKSKKIIPYFTVGYPSTVDTKDLVFAAEKAGASMIELGMPFSDPLADGPIIQESSQLAIKSGVSIDYIFQSVRDIRKKSNIPLALMGYVNPIINYGMKEFISECKDIGVDGLIIPDLPLEEASEYVQLSRKNSISPILLVAPNTSPVRIKEISEISKDLIYCVAVLGITGGNSANLEELQSYLKRVDNNSSCPFIVGFGVKNRDDVIEINKIAHGAVIGSAMINELKQSNAPIKTVEDYIIKIMR